MITANRMILSAAALALFTAGGVAAQSRSATTAVSAPEQVRPDANGDGNLTRAEAMAAAEARFARMDASRDGRIDAADREAGRERRRDAMFARMDSDSNGSVTRAEFDAASEAMDARRAERRETRSERREGRADRRGGDRRGPGARAYRAGQRMEQARMADTNNDRAIDRAEFMAAAEARFARADSNRDGTVTAAERQAQRGERRGRRGGEGMAPPPPPVGNE